MIRGNNVDYNDSRRCESAYTSLSDLDLLQRARDFTRTYLRECSERDEAFSGECHHD